MDQGNKVLPVVLVRLFPDPFLVGGCTIIELFDGDSWYARVFLYAFKLSNMSGRNILNYRIIIAQISSVIFNIWTIHFSTFSSGNRAILPTIYIADRTTSFSNPLRKLPKNPNRQRTRGCERFDTALSEPDETAFNATAVRTCVPTCTYGEDAPGQDGYYTGYCQYLTDASHHGTELVMRSSLRTLVSRAI